MQGRKIFSVFRYQLLPTTTKIQTRIDQLYTSYEDLIEKKNDIFADVVLSDKTKFKGKGYNVITKIDYVENEHIFLRMGVHKTINLHDENFIEQKAHNYPNSMVYINNKKDKQFILIEQEIEAFNKTSVLQNILMKSINNNLNKYQLSIYIEKITDISKFWDTIFEYEGRIKMLRFEFIKPNMSNISGKAVQAIKMLRNKSNSHKTKLELNAPEKGVLENLNPDNEEISSLAEYSAKGGGVPMIKIKNYRKLIKTNKREETIEVDELNIIDQPFKKIQKILNTLFTNKIEDKHS